MDTENLSEENARQKVRRMDRRRSDNYHYYTRRIWGFQPPGQLHKLGAEALEEIILLPWWTSTEKAAYEPLFFTAAATGTTGPSAF